jgi:NitT/TauT family transport system permease protein
VKTAALRTRVVAWIVPFLLGLATLAVAVRSVETLIDRGVINHFIVPLPSEVAEAFGRVIAEEDIAARFRLTFFEALTASAMITVIGIAVGLLLYRISLLRAATETWVAALASAPTGSCSPRSCSRRRCRRSSSASASG